MTRGFATKYARDLHYPKTGIDVGTSEVRDGIGMAPNKRCVRLVTVYHIARAKEIEPVRNEDDRKR